MTQTRAPSVVNSAEALLGRIAGEFTDRLQRGEQPDVEEYARRHPELAEVLRQVLPALHLLQPGKAEAPGEGVTGTLGDYRIVREVGRGGMGVVYEAEQISLGRRVALKVLPFAATMDPRHLQRFHNEARAAASLHHPHIVPVYAVGQDRGVHFYAMQFIDGRTLAELIAERRPSDPRPSGSGEETAPLAAAPTVPTLPDAGGCRPVAEWGIQAALALEHAHSLGIVHRDVKPANLMLDAQGKLWVTDFGLARTAADSDLTVSGDVLGTLRYMSPEQALARHGLVDHRTDVYSLGATLYELLTLTAAFRGADRQELLRRIGDEEPRPPRHVNPAVASDLETIVLKAMAKEPAERYATAGELADDLRRFLEHQPIRARRAGLAVRLRKWGRRHRTATAAIAVGSLVTLVVLAVSSVLLWREKEQVKRALAEKEQEGRRAEAHFNKLVGGIPDDVLREIYDERWSRIPEVAKLRLAASARLEQVYLRLKDESNGDPKLCLQAGWMCQNLGEFHLARWEHTRAEALFRRAVSIHEELASAYPDDKDQVSWHAQALYRLGRALHALGKAREARDLFLQSKELMQRRFRRAPTWNGYIALTGFLCECHDESLRDPQEALLMATRAVELKPDSDESWYWLGVAQYRAKQWGAARASLLHAAETSRKDPALAYYLAATFGRLGDKDEARAYLKWGDQIVEDRFGGVIKYQNQVKRAEAAAVLGLREEPKPGLRLPPQTPSSPLGPSGPGR